MSEIYLGELFVRGIWYMPILKINGIIKLDHIIFGIGIIGYCRTPPFYRYELFFHHTFFLIKKYAKNQGFIKFIANLQAH